MGAAVLVLGVIFWVAANSPSNRASNPYADLGVVEGGVLVCLGFISIAAFSVAARGLWKQRSYGAITMVAANGVGLLISLPQIGKNPIGTAVAGIAGIGAAAGCAVVARQRPSELE